MTGRERFLAAIHNKKPDRLPCQVHSWMQYYLNTYLSGRDQYQAYEYFGMDPVIYESPEYIYDSNDIACWTEKYTELGTGSDGNRNFRLDITTPEGTLSTKGASNVYTSWETEHLIKSKNDMELFLKYYPKPSGADWSRINAAKKRIGDTGIVRMHHQNYGQPGVWQSFTYLVGTQEAIMMTFDEPEYVHRVLQAIAEKSVKSIERIGKIEADLVENGGGSASSTVISPAIHREFCLLYDRMVHAALKKQGAMIVYHLCGGHMPLLETVAENGADCLETLTPPGMGADCRLGEAKSRVGGKLGFIGGFDQLAGFEKGTPEAVRRQVFELFEACPDGGYICSPSDHFFSGPPENVRAFADACKECKY